MSTKNLNKYIDSKINAYREIEYNVSEYTFKAYIEDNDHDAINRLASKVIEPELDNPELMDMVYDDPDVIQWTDQQNTTANEVEFCRRYCICGSARLLAAYLDENSY